MKWLIALAVLVAGCAQYPRARPAAWSDPMLMQSSSSPMPVVPLSCGAVGSEFLVRAWEARDGRCPGEPITSPGVAAVESPRSEFATRTFTFEAWIRWPEDVRRFRPQILAEAAGGGWSWSLRLDEVGSLVFAWQEGEYRNQVVGEIGYDIIRPGVWYHAAVVFFDHAYTNEPYVTDYAVAALYFTEAGRPLATCVGVLQNFATPGQGPRDPAALAVGRGLKDESSGQARIGSAAFDRASRTPADYPALGGGALPAGISIDGDFEGGSLGRAFAVGGDLIAFSPALYAHCQNYWYAFRVRGAAGRTLTFYCPDANGMMITPVVSEDGGKTWMRPSHGTIRRTSYGYQGHIALTHRFAGNEAIVAGTPIVTTTMAGEWIDSAARRLGARIHVVGRSPDGRPLRIIEIGNPDAPLIYFQAGQHSMCERIGFHTIAAAFESAAADAELLKRTRWMVMPVVNVDSYLVAHRDGDQNMNRIWRAEDTHPTTGSIRRFLERETSRTGVIAAFDFHAGGVWRGHTMLGSSAASEQFEKALQAEGLVLNIRRRPAPATAAAPATASAPATMSFSGFAATLPGIRVACTIELAQAAARSPQGAGPTTVQWLREDGQAWYRAIKRWLSIQAEM
jgi:hypothetical protein